MIDFLKNAMTCEVITQMEPEFLSSDDEGPMKPKKKTLQKW